MMQEHNIGQRFFFNRAVARSASARQGRDKDSPFVARSEATEKSTAIIITTLVTQKPR